MSPSLTILEGDVLDRLADLPSESVQTCVSSPPYWALRDYNIAQTAWPQITFVPIAGLPPMTIAPQKACLGLEKDPWAFVGHMVHVYRLIHRVLKDDGTIWVNLGDSYSSSAGGYNAEGSMGASCNKRISKKTMRAVLKDKSRMPPPGLKPKDLCGIPWRVAYALQADGWHLRCDIIWHKPNPMPESCSDRPTKAHEYLFFLSKQGRYYYDQKAICEAASLNTHARRSLAAMEFPGRQLRDENRRHTIKMPDGWDSGAGSHGSIHRNGREKGKTSWKGSEFSKGKTAVHQLGRSQSSESRKMGKHADGVKNNPSYEEAMSNLVDTRNKRSVWIVPSYPFKEAHFATFPPDLIKPCILAGSRAGDTVLDPFGGSGTTGMVAIELGRNATLIELNPEYVAMARRRCLVTPGLNLETK
jgi:DNA modification methylase